jgi:ubiquinone/menaquinone biosynthesis C-methylase UbiE
MTYAPQVDKTHYGKKYRAQDRWDAYFHQLTLVSRAAPATVLEIGPGEGVVSREMRAQDITVTTVDIAPDLAPDIVASVTKLPLAEQSFDAVVACEILEHIRFEDVPQALSEIARVTKRHVIISLPHPGNILFSAIVKVPFLKLFSIRIQVPFFWKTHVFNGEHYWELGKRGYSVNRFLAAAREAGLKCVLNTKFTDDPAHRFFLFEKTIV